jgi:hypothetical protein
MNIQHSQQIQHIRYAKQYTQFARRPASRRGSRGRRFGIAFTAIAAMVGFTGVAFSSSAHAQRPTEGASIPTTAVSPDTNTVTTPCFRGAGGPTVAYEAAASECTHTYGAPYEGFGFQGGGGGPSEGATEARIDGWMHHPVDNVSYGQFMPAETDGWAHHQHIQVPGETDVATDGWAHYSHQVTVPVTTERASWRDCFTSKSTYQAWTKAQVGMPMCSSVNP